MSEQTRLDEAAEWEGHWWIPNEDRAVPGILRYAPGSELRLNLIGGFEGRVLRHLEGGGVEELDDVKRQEVIWGLVEGKDVTLFDCLPIHTRRRGFDELPERQVIKADRALIGMHVEGKDIPKFKQCWVSVENLGLWGGAHGITRETTYDGNHFTRGSVSVEWPEEPSVMIGGTTISLAHELSPGHIDRQRGSTIGTVRDTAFVRIETVEPFSVHEALAFVRRIQDLVSLATHRSAGLLWVRLRAPHDDDDKTEGAYDTKGVLYLPSAFLGESEAPAIHRHDILFGCDHVPFEEIIPRWWAAHEKLRAASNMLLGLRYAPSRFVESNLLLAVGAAETLHRALRPDGRRMPPGDFAELRETVLRNVPQEHRGWIKSSVRNEVTLRERLRVLASIPDAIAMERLVPDVEHWAKVTTQVRNDLAHTGETRRRTIDELIAVTEVTSAVIVLNLLQALGVDPERQREVVNDHPAIAWTVLRARTQLIDVDAASS